MACWVRHRKLVLGVSVHQVTAGGLRAVSVVLVAPVLTVLQLLMCLGAPASSALARLPYWLAVHALVLVLMAMTLLHCHCRVSLVLPCRCLVETR